MANGGTTTGPQPPQETTDTPISTQLMPPPQDDQGAAAQPGQQPQQPQQAPVQAAQPAPPPKPGSFFKNMSHAFIGAVLGQAVDDHKRVGGIGGQKQVQIDPQTGAQKVVPVPMSVTQRLGTIADRMLSGLASVPDTAPISALGKSYEAQQTAKKEKLEESKKTQEEGFKREQDMKMQKYDLAYKNAMTQRLAVETMKTRNDLDPLLPEHRELMQAIQNSPDLKDWQVREVGQQELSDIMKQGHNTNSQILPLGMQPKLDEQGNYVMDPQTNAPMGEMRYGLITGPEGAQHQGNIVISPTIASEISQFGPKVGLGDSVKSFTAGTEMPIRQFVQIMGKVNEERAKVVAGWNVPKIGLQADGKTPVMLNSYDSSQPPRPVSYLTPEFEEGQAKTDQQKAAAEKDRADAKNQLAQAAMYAQGMFGPNAGAGTPAWNTMYNGVQSAIAKMPPEYRSAAVGISHEVSPQSMMSLLTVANGDADMTKTFPSSPRKGVPLITAQQALPYLKLLNPQWSEGLYGEKQTALKAFGTGPEGQAIGSFNRFLSHSDELVNLSQQLQGKLTSTGVPLLDTPLRDLQNRFAGDPGVPSLLAAIVAPRDEWQSFLKNGHASDLSENEEARKIMDQGSTPRQILGAIQIMAGQGIARLDTIDAEWSRLWGGHYPGTMTPAGAKAAQDLGLGALIQDYLVGGTVGGVYSTQPAAQSQNNPPAPPGATAVVKVNGVTTGHVVNNTFVPLRPTTPQAAEAPAAPAQ